MPLKCESVCVLCIFRHVCLSVLWDTEAHLLQHRAGFPAIAAAFGDLALWSPSLVLWISESFVDMTS